MIIFLYRQVYRTPRTRAGVARSRGMLRASSASFRSRASQSWASKISSEDSERREHSAKAPPTALACYHRQGEWMARAPHGTAPWSSCASATHVHIRSLLRVLPRTADVQHPSKLAQRAGRNQCTHSMPARTRTTIARALEQDVKHSKLSACRNKTDKDATSHEQLEMPCSPTLYLVRELASIIPEPWRDYSERN